MAENGCRVVVIVFLFNSVVEHKIREANNESLPVVLFCNSKFFEVLTVAFQWSKVVAMHRKSVEFFKLFALRSLGNELVSP